MHKAIYNIVRNLSKGDRAELKRASLTQLRDTSAYFRVLKYSGQKDSGQAARITYLLVNANISDEEPVDLIYALHSAGVKEDHIKQICRSGQNSIEYLKRQITRCKNVSADDIGGLAQYWGESSRRNLLKEFILFNTEENT